MPVLTSRLYRTPTMSLHPGRFSSDCGGCEITSKWKTRTDICKFSEEYITAKFCVSSLPEPLGMKGLCVSFKSNFVYVNK